MQYAESARKTPPRRTAPVRQLKLQSASGWTDTKAVPGTPDQVTSGGTNPLTGSPKLAHVFVTHERAQNKPKNLVGMDTWHSYLKDPSRSNVQTLTRMHAINGTFWGPPTPDNIFLGTAASNNSSSMSHLHQVEIPIRDFLGKKGSNHGVGVDYSVQPQYGKLPPYMQARVDGIANAKTRGDFEAWAKQGVPDFYTCKATFYRKPPGKGLQMIPTQTETLNADIGAPTMATAKKTAIIGGVGALLGGIGGVLAGVASAPILVPAAAAVGTGIAAAAIGSLLGGGGAADALHALPKSIVHIGGHALRGKRAKAGAYKGM